MYVILTSYFWKNPTMNCILFCFTATDALQTVHKLAELFRELPYLADSSVVCSFSPWVIYTVRRYIPEAIVALTHQHRVYQYTADGVRKNESYFHHALAFVSTNQRRIP